MKHGSITSLQSQIGSAEWTAAGESQPKTQTSAGKDLASVFWDAQGILFIDYLEKGKTTNNEYYIALLVHLKKEIATKWPQMKKKKVLFHQDNAPSHKSIAEMAKLHELKCFRTNSILQIWSLATTGCLRTSKECSRERDLSLMKK